MIRIRMKVWTSPEGERFMATQGISLAGSERLSVLVMQDGVARTVAMSWDEWDALPFFWFEEAAAAASPGSIPLLPLLPPRTVAELKTALLKTVPTAGISGLLDAVHALPDTKRLAYMPDSVQRTIRVLLEQCIDYKEVTS